MTYYVQLRMTWIAETLRVFGFINRHHIERKFGVSTVQASVDLKRFAELHPGTMRYDAKEKRYLVTTPPERGTVRAPGPQKALPPAACGHVP